MFSERQMNTARLLVDDASQRRLRFAFAESCTGGLLSALIVSIAGSSRVLDRSFITYSNHAKEEMLGVQGDFLADFGAVSEPVARMMAEGALTESRANIALSITGVAGPGGGSPMKPVGTVHMALARENHPIRHEHHFFDHLDRTGIRTASVDAAMDMLAAAVRG